MYATDQIQSWCDCLQDLCDVAANLGHLLCRFRALETKSVEQGDVWMYVRWGETVQADASGRAV